jgi:DNA (cytosine-5)-methyltransferase 1
MTFKVIDLFCGAGGFSEGFRQAGCTIVAGQDANFQAGETFKKNHPESKFVPGPINAFQPKKLLGSLGLKPEEIDAVIGGPPCQDYSPANIHRSSDTDRANLFGSYLAVVEHVRPRWVVIENVKTMENVQGRNIRKEIQDKLSDFGYKSDARTLHAEKYGVPQSRERMFIIATNTGAPIKFPRPTHAKRSLKRFVPEWDAISDLPTLRNGEEKIGAQNYKDKAKNDYQRSMRRGRRSVKNNVVTELDIGTVRKIEKIKPGQNWNSLEKKQLPESLIDERQTSHSTRLRRPGEKDLACTILTRMNPNGGAFVHPKDNRVLSVREGARIQSFPDKYEFLGSKVEQYTQVGNAVPPLVAQKVAEAVLASDKYRVESSHGQ